MVVWAALPPVLLLRLWPQAERLPPRPHGLRPYRVAPSDPICLVRCIFHRLERGGLPLRRLLPRRRLRRGRLLTMAMGVLVLRMTWPTGRTAVLGRVALAVARFLPPSHSFSRLIASTPPRPSMRRFQKSSS